MHYHDLKIQHQLVSQEITMQRRLQKKLGKALAWSHKEKKNNVRFKGQLGDSQRRRATLKVNARLLHLAKMYRKGTPFKKVETPNKAGEYKALPTHVNLMALIGCSLTSFDKWVTA